MADLLANRGDVGINGLWRDIQSGIPDALEKLGAAENCAWVFGHEGQGVGEGAAALCTGSVRIVQPGGEESLNVATAAAICLHASAAARA